jgi:hypothetical protein
MKKNFPSLTVVGLVLLSFLAACVSSTPVVTPQAPTSLPPSLTPSAIPPSPVLSPTSLPTVVPVFTQPPYSTPTPVPVSQLRGEWSRYTTADGFCTNSPILIDLHFIGTGTTSLCSFHKGSWTSKTVPQGTIVTAAHLFPPGGGWIVATDIGICGYAYLEWRCKTQADGFPYKGIREIANINELSVYMLADSVVFLENVYRIPEIVGAAEAIPTRIAVSSEKFGVGFLPREIWVGTNGYGIVVIQPDTGEITRYTTQDGLPRDEIRDISTEDCPRYCDYRDVWVATEQGIAHWDGTTWKTYTIENGLPSNDIRGVSSWWRNLVWAATGAGAAYFDGQDWKVYTHENGLPEGDLTGVVWARDEILFSTRNSGLLVFTMKNP